MAGQQVNGTEHFGRQLGPVLSERPHKPAPRLSIGTQRRLCIAEIAFQYHRRAVVQRVCQRGWRVNPLESTVPQRQ